VRTTLGRRAADLPRLSGQAPSHRQLAANLANRGKPLNTCDHDWRIDTTLVLDSNPPQQYVLCTRCGASFTRVIPPDDPASSQQPRDG
jgi:hypothetical protein